MIMWNRLVVTVLTYLYSLVLVDGWNGLNKMGVQFILNLDADHLCAGPLIVTDVNYEENEELDSLIEQSRSYTLLENSNGTIGIYNFENLHQMEEEIACRDVVLYIRQLDHVLSLYQQIYSANYVRHFVIIMSGSNVKKQTADHILFEIKNEHVWVLNERGENDLETNRWIISDQIQRRRFSGILPKKEIHSGALMGRHLTIATLDFPPIVFVKPQEIKNGTLLDVTGIEPSLMDILAQSLNFQISYVLPVNNEMWGTLIFNGDNVTVTGMLGLLHAGKVDVAYGDLHIQQRLLPYVDFTSAFRNNYECLLIPAPKPYAKWTALYHPFSPTIWVATGVAFVCAVVTLRVLAVWASSWHQQADIFFNDWVVCWLYILGSMVGVKDTKEAHLPANRFFLAWWLLTAATILPTLYRSGLISYITLPFSPMPIDTLQELIDSNTLRPISWGLYYKTSLLNSTQSLEHKLGEKMMVATNVTNMFSTLESESWAIMSNQGNLRYEAAARFPTSSDGPRVHLMKECVFPTRSGLGLQKQSSLKRYFDGGIIRLTEAGIVDHITSVFAKKLDEWDPHQAHTGKQLAPYSLDSLQGAFYLWAMGIGLSMLAFIVECIFGYHFQRK